MWLYKVLDGLFPSSFAAKLHFVAFCAAAVPPVMVAVYLAMLGGRDALLSPVLFLVILSCGLSVTVNAIGIQALVQPLRDLRRTLGLVHSRRTYRPLPTRHADDIGVAMQATNRLAESMGARLDPALVDGAIDPLTGVFKPEALEPALLEVEAGSMLAVSIDDYAGIQHGFGPAAADRLMAACGRVLRDTTRKGDVIGVRREGEFCVFLRGAGREVARHVADRIRARIDTETAEMQPGATLSIGLAVRSPDEETGAVWSRAEQAMHSALVEGHDRVVLAAAG